MMEEYALYVELTEGVELDDILFAGFNALGLPPEFEHSWRGECPNGVEG